jgi:hypothetical protein
LKQVVVGLVLAAWLVPGVGVLPGACAGLVLEGRLISGDGQVAAGESVEMTLRIYDDESAGTLLYEESQKIAAGSDFSRFTFEKGKVSVRKREADVPAGDLWVEVEYDGRIMTPRLSLAELGASRDLESEDRAVRQARLRSSGPPTVIIGDSGVVIGGLLDMGTNPIKLSGVARNEWLQDRVESLESEVDSLKTEVNALKSLLQHFSRNGNEITIAGANLHIVNGTGSTDGTPNGLGNLIVGYNALRGGGDDDRSGSHNIVVGDRNNFTSYGGLVAGDSNTISGKYSSVSGGRKNEASGDFSSVSGGGFNEASGEESSVSGGASNTASGDSSSVSGGLVNKAGG